MCSPPLLPPLPLPPPLQTSCAAVSPAPGASAATVSCMCVCKRPIKVQKETYYNAKETYHIASVATVSCKHDIRLRMHVGTILRIR